jgi:tetratricopeptide (TPR) repeat protein
MAGSTLNRGELTEPRGIPLGGPLNRIWQRKHQLVSIGLDLSDLAFNYHSTMSVFDISPELAASLDGMDNQQLLLFAQSHEDRPDDSDIELRIYVERLIYQRQGSADHLNEAIRRANLWFTATPETHSDKDRRRDILDTLFAQKVALMESDESSLTVDAAEQQQHQQPESSAQANAASSASIPPIVPGVPPTARDQMLLDLIAANPDIQAAQRLLAGHPDPASQWNALGIQFTARAESTHAREDLTRAAMFLQLAVITAPKDHINLPMFLNNWAACLQRLFEVSGVRNDLNFSIKAAEEATELAGPEHPDWPMFVNTLGGSLGNRYSVDGNMEDLDRAIAAKEECVRSTPPDHLKRFTRMQSLAQSLFQRYEKTEQIEDLRRGIDVVEESLSLVTFRDRYYSQTVIDIATRLIKLSQKTGLGQDVDRLVSNLENVVNTTPSDIPARPLFLSLLLHALKIRHSHTQDLQNLDHAIVVGEEIAQLPTVEMVIEISYLKVLSESYLGRFEITGQLPDIIRAIELSEKLLTLLPPEHPDRPECLSNLARSFGRRGETTLRIQDFEEAISYADLSVQIVPNHKNRAMHLHVLGGSLMRHYEITGSIQELDRTIEVYKMAVIIEAQGPFRAQHIASLGLALCLRYDRLREHKDLNNAFVALSSALKLPHQTDHAKQRYLNGLGAIYVYRFRRLDEREDLDRAVEMFSDAVDATPLEQPDRHIVLLNLGTSLSDRYRQFGVSEDLERAIDAHEKAVKASPKDSLFKAQNLKGLASCLELQYSAKEDIQDLDRAINLYSEAASLVSAAHSSRVTYLLDFGKALNIKFRRTRQKEDKERSLELLREGWKCENGVLLDRARIGMALADILGEQSAWVEAYEVLKDVVGLIPLIGSRSLNPDDQQFMIKDISGVAQDAAAAALHAGQSSLHALQLLELGRGVVSGRMLDMRRDVSELMQQHPGLASRLTSLWDQLSYSEITAHTIELDTTPFRLSLKEQQRLEANKNLVLLLKEIQAQPGFEDFLGPPSEEDFKSAAAHGPVVVINFSNFRSDAFIIERHRIRVLRLPRLTTEDLLANIHRQNVVKSLLEWLWNVAAKPILDALDFTAPPENDESWPHVWWILLGPLAYIPIHAAGYHETGSTNSVLDRVMSSYSASTKALLYTRRRKTREMPQLTSASALLVAMKETPGLGTSSLLEYADQEIAMLRDVCSSLKLTPKEPEACRYEVLKELRRCYIFHFAGHGSSSSGDPSYSSLLLNDWQENLLSVKDIWEQDLKESAPFLGYLSACSTSNSRSSKLSDEGIHMASAFQLAGFRHVIGAVLDVSDKRCVTVARILYQTMVDKGMNDATVCLGLHLAVRQLRSEAQSLVKPSTDKDETRKSSQEDMNAVRIYTTECLLR